MRAATWTTTGTLETTDIAAPPERPGSLFVRPAVVGICGSDLHFFRGQFQPAVGRVPGHEIAGRVVEGDGFAPGQLIAVEPSIGCGRCASCRRGQVPTCDRLRLIGISAPGGMAELLSVPVANAHPLPEGIDEHIGALAEPVAVCVRGINRAEMVAGSRVLVLGSGTIGLISAMLAAPLASEVAVTARYPHQAELAEAFGATRVFQPGSEALRAWVAANPVDLVIETVGGEANTLGEAIELVRGGGTVLPLGVFTVDVPVSARKLVNQEVRVIGSVVYGHTAGQSEFGAAVGLLPRFASQLALLKTATYPLDEANAAFEHALDKSRKTVKISVAVQ
jgi:threonine dehydrogenase-like Zn-dependent dehydrogenase